ncbi:hypothetical protein NTH_03980 [Nitratireductor thuwali]|uniref:Uncharacterized protein n=1 Tax=Nitratireductor thuwali TaxID=2267699 RepID=A0ABY5MNT2_9HYPH|nr:hypothetical protein NTH_03980 [Nitratireductor thuwali]
MTRRAARITHDEVRRLIKAVLSAGLPIERVCFDGERVEVFTSEAKSICHENDRAEFETLQEYLCWRDRNIGLIREPKA